MYIEGDSRVCRKTEAHPDSIRAADIATLYLLAARSGRYFPFSYLIPSRLVNQLIPSKMNTV